MSGINECVCVFGVLVLVLRKKQRMISAARKQRQKTQKKQRMVSAMQRQTEKDKEKIRMTNAKSNAKAGC